MRKISLLDGKIIVYIYENREGKIEGGSTEDFLQDKCEFCGLTRCYYNCDESTAYLDDISQKDRTESESEVNYRMQFNSAIEGVTALVLAQACWGIDVENEKYQESLQASLDEIGNYYTPVILKG